MTPLRPALAVLCAMTLLTGIAYPAVVTVLAQWAFATQANGSLIVRDGTVAGSSLLGQAFTDPKYFWGRPSATARVPYDGGASGGANLGPLHDGLVAAVRDRVSALRGADPGARGVVPVDLVTASASGLDPHISPAAAEYQVPRVARVRGLPEALVRALVVRHTTGRTWGILGQPVVAVLPLNVALDATSVPR